MASQAPTPSPSKTLPLRLLRAIVAFTVDDSTLLQLLLCSRALHLEAERILYSTFGSRRLVDAYEWTAVPVESLLKFLERTLSSGRLASYVKRITLHLNPEDPQLPQFWTLFEQALARMNNVKVFGV
jgi:hypothetical protein